MTAKRSQTLAGGKRSATSGKQRTYRQHPEGMPDGKVIHVWHPFGMQRDRRDASGGGAALTTG
jgi:hypothetical protein